MSPISPRPLAIAACAVTLIGACSSALGVPATWSPLDDEPNASVNALDLGTGTLWAGGGFTHLPFGFPVAIPRNHIGQWNGSAWGDAGTGANGSVLAIQATPSGTVYAGGSFSGAGGSGGTQFLAKWDGSSWSSVGAGVNGTADEVRAMTLAGGDLYVGGKFWDTNNYNVDHYLPFNKIAKFDGTAWSAVGTPPWGLNYTESINAIAVDGAGNVYAGGDFTVGGGAPADYLAKWNGTSWSAVGAVGARVNAAVYSLALDGSGNLYAGGAFAFTPAGGDPVNSVGKWNGSSWSALGTGVNGVVRALEAVDYCGQTTLYAGGAFTTAGGNPAGHIAAWSGGQWSQVGNGFTGNEVLALAAPDPNTLYAGGDFTFAVGFTIKMNLGQATVTNRACAPTAANAASTTPGEAVVMWSNPASGPAWTNLVATASPGGATCSSASGTSCVIQGLTNGTPYTFTVKATNAAGDSPLSNTTDPVTPTGPPDAPTGVTAVAGQDRATVSWTAPASNGGAAITAYTATATPGGGTCTTTGATSCTVTGLTPGTAYTFVVTATNRVGTSAASAASASVTPTVPPAPSAPATPSAAPQGGATPAPVIPAIGAATAVKNGVGTTTGTVPAGATSISQTATTGGSTATQGFLEMAKAKTAKGKCAITVVRNKKTKKVTKRTYRCTIRLSKGTWTVTTTARGAAGVVAESSRRVVVK